MCKRQLLGYLHQNWLVSYLFHCLAVQCFIRLRRIMPSSFDVVVYKPLISEIYIAWKIRQVEDHANLWKYSFKWVTPYQPYSSYWSYFRLRTINRDAAFKTYLRGWRCLDACINAVTMLNSTGEKRANEYFSSICSQRSTCSLNLLQVVKSTSRQTSYVFGKIRLSAEDNFDACDIC